MKIITTGIEDFKEIIDGNYYYVDKSHLIEVIKDTKVSIVDRPRRFGKTLNMSMLYYFYSNKEKDNAYLFDHLKINNNQELMKEQNCYPVIFLSLKNVFGKTFNETIAVLSGLITYLLDNFQELLTSDELSERAKKDIKILSNRCDDINLLKDSLLLISDCLAKHYHEKVIILIDEYDVPLNSAYQNGYYDEMTLFFKAFLSNALKTNNYLHKAVLSGCLRIVKESIFTGLNNFNVFSILDKKGADCYGFTQKEIDELLLYYDLNDKNETMKEWYNGYLFGNKEIYNPWSTLYYVNSLLVDRNEKAISYWANTSSNDIVYHYIQNGDQQMKEDFDKLIQGKSITKKILHELTYREMDDINNIYSFLLFTGYLKIVKQLENNIYELLTFSPQLK